MEREILAEAHIYRSRDLLTNGEEDSRVALGFQIGKTEQE